MKIKLLLPVILLVLAVTQGCVSNKKYAALQSDYNKSLDTNRNLKQSWQVTQQELAGSRGQVQSLPGPNSLGKIKCPCFTGCVE